MVHSQLKRHRNVHHIQRVTPDRAGVSGDLAYICGQARPVDIGDGGVIIAAGSGSTPPGRTGWISHALRRRPRTAELIGSCDLSRLRGLFAGYRYVFLDETQHMPNVATALKIVYDDPEEEHAPRFLVTGSSSLSLAVGTREALTGRTWSYVIYPIAFQE